MRSVRVEVNHSWIFRDSKTLISMLIPIRLTSKTKRPTTVLFSKVIFISLTQLATQLSARNTKKGIKIIKFSQWIHSLCKLMQIIIIKIHLLHLMINLIRELLLNLLWKIGILMHLEMLKMFSIQLSISKLILSNKFNCLPIYI